VIHLVTVLLSDSCVSVYYEGQYKNVEVALLETEVGSVILRKCQQTGLSPSEIMNSFIEAKLLIKLAQNNKSECKNKTEGPVHACICLVEGKYFVSEFIVIIRQ
jgi:hypothetical protein